MRTGYFLELMDHGIEIERRVPDGLLEIGKKLGIPPLVTNDSHYTYASEAGAHDALLCIQTGKNLSDPDRFRLGLLAGVPTRSWSRTISTPRACSSSGT
ncbi:hypothetical protein OG373_41090 [Streptomyces avidinii]|nr:hypothetical protein OG373_41090 [Streptomyces avidinii]